MEYLLLCYPKCGTCQKAKKWLGERGISYTERNIREQNPTREELEVWVKKSGLPLKRFFNTSGTAYRALKLSQRLPEMDEARQLDLLSSDGMLVKRPILVGGDTVLVGFWEQEWERLSSF